MINKENSFGFKSCKADWPLQEAVLMLTKLNCLQRLGSCLLFLPLSHTLSCPRWPVLLILPDSNYKLNQETSRQWPQASVSLSALPASCVTSSPSVLHPASLTYTVTHITKCPSHPQPSSFSKDNMSHTCLTCTAVGFHDWRRGQVHGAKGPLLPTDPLQVGARYSREPPDIRTTV